MITRRHLLSLAGGAMAGAYLRAAIPEARFQIDRLQSEHDFAPVLNEFRAYRADAVITLFSVAVFSRAGVGSGVASFREGCDAGRRIVSMSFAGGSYPERAHKLNRLGFIQEVVLESGDQPQEAAYFGFMTSSPEESVSDAKKALASSAETVPYTAVEGEAVGGQLRNRKTKILLPSRLTFADWRGLRDRIRAEFYLSDPATTEMPSPPRTLLHCVSQAIRRPAGHTETSYVYNGRQYHLKIDKAPDKGAGASFVTKGLAESADRVHVLRGSIKGLLSGRVTNFRLWAEDDPKRVLPLRIELQPRSFLRLAFEFDPTLSKGGV